ncbi:MAG: metalloregulator ArsR/SmtB family transcription factor [Anaerolineae bacterium]|nr:metalloregulator ArsR/SmtB family transcription factor [Anaerolineae bacterium]
MPQEEFELLLNFFKVLGNDTRLKIVGILANQDCTVKELAEMLGLREPTVSEHLSMLKHFGFVTVTPRGNQRVYAFDPKSLHAMSKEVFSRERLASIVDDVVNEDERKILQAFVVGDRIRAFPTSDKKFRIMLKWLLQKFELGRRYTEKEVNDIFKRYHEDSATLRRMMVEYGYMNRDKGQYWRVESKEIP